MTNRLRGLRMVALAGCCFPLSCGLLLGQQSQPGLDAKTSAAQIPSDVDAPIAKSRMLAAFREGSSLKRVALLEDVDSSPAVDEAAAVSLLQDALHDKDPLVRETALRALIRRDTEQNPVLNEADVAPFKGEVAELARVHFAAKHEDTAALKELLQNGDAVVQESALEQLATRDLAGAVEALKSELRDGKSLYRLQTLELLVRSPYTNSWDRLQPVLEEAARDQDPMLREYAVQVLKEKKLENQK